MNDKKLINIGKEDIINALLVSIRIPEITDEEAKNSLMELERLATTLGLKVIATESQRLRNTSGVTVVGEGKLQELKRHITEREDSADVVIFDCELSPSQIRNVENELNVQVMDRTAVIIEIFSRHAKTRESRLQVEIARLNYLAPRLRENKKVGDRQHFAGRGAGESQLELDRRRVRDRKAELKRELEQLQKEDEGRRSLREEQMNVVLVGYTNAGKSSCMRALTGSEVLVEDKLFATLDTTVRALQPETRPRILISDTVGFINKLPHDLVASFHSTLEEAKNAFLHLHIVDAADPAFRPQLEVVKEVLGEIGAADVPHLLVLNKSDCLTLEERDNLQQEFPDALIISSRNTEDIQILHDWITAFFNKSMVEEKILVPYKLNGVIGRIRNNTKVLNESYDEEGTHFVVRSHIREIERLKKLLKN